MHGAKGGGVNRYASGGEVVVPHRLHAHHRKQTADSRQFRSGAQADGAVAFHAQALDFAGTLQLVRQARFAVEHMCIGLGHQLQQRPI